MTPQFKVERQILTSGNWYEVMLSPFTTEEQAWDYIKKYHSVYPLEHQNYRITHRSDNTEITHYFRGQFA